MYNHLLESITDSDFVAADTAPREQSFNAEQVRVAAKDNLNLLASLAMPDEFEHFFPPVLLAAWELLTRWANSNDPLEQFPKIALGIPRGHAKTTIVKLFCLYCILYTDRRFILVLSDTATKAENIISDVVDMLEEDNIRKLFGDWRVGVETNRQDLKKFPFRGRVIVIAALGALGSVRGLNIKNSRPDVMIFDDVQSRECSDSIPMSTALLTWFSGTAMKAKSPRRCLFIVAGNMFPGDNCLLKKLKDNSNWIKFISGAILADGTALWEKLRPLASLVEELNDDVAMGQAGTFFSEVMNDTEVGANKNVDLAAIRAWPWEDNELPQGKFIVIDPSGDNPSSDATTIGCFYVYDGVPGLRELVEDKLSPGNTIRRALLLALKHGCRVIVVESVAYQASLLYWFGVIAEQLGIGGMQFLPIPSGGVSKNARISTMLNGLQAGEQCLHKAVRSMVEHQIINWNPMKRNNVDGILDILVYGPKVVDMYRDSIVTAEALEITESASPGVPDFTSSF